MSIDLSEALARSVLYGLLTDGFGYPDADLEERLLKVGVTATADGNVPQEEL